MRLEIALGVAAALALSCGGGSSGTAGGQTAAANKPTADAKVHQCGDSDKTHAYDLHDEDGDDALVPCSKNC